MDELDDLKKTIKEQDKQIRLLKNAIMRLEQRVNFTKKIADRASYQSKKNTSEINSLSSTIKRTQ